MICPPREADTTRTVIEAIPVTTSSNWWTGLVHDRDDDSDEERLRLERLVENPGGYDRSHTWRIRPEFWEAERDAVTALDHHRVQGQSLPGDLPIDQHLTPREYVCIRKDDVRWVAPVRIDRPYKGECIRLYHWTPEGRLRQKWTVGRDWSELESLATRYWEQNLGACPLVD